VQENIQIAIDGPAGAGKSTVAKAVAQELGLFYVDTGAMYRVIAYKALGLNISLEQEEEVSALAWSTEVQLDHSAARRVYCDGEDVTQAIREPEISRAVSRVASYPKVRERLVELQRQEAKRGGVVMDGRDIGTHVLPDAKLKVFLTASLDERARRRWLELERSGKNLELEDVKEDMERRDRLDAERDVSPLMPAEDAVILDTTGLSVGDIVKQILDLVRD
jgi:cytidylate kinase